MTLENETVEKTQENNEKPKPKPKGFDINIWKIKKQIPNFLYNAFLKTLKNPEKLSESVLDSKYKKFMNKKLFKD